MTTIEFFFSPGSRYCYLAASQMPGLERDVGCRVVWRPVHGPALRARRGRDPFAGEPISGQYDWTYRRVDAERWAALYGITYRDPPTPHFDFELLARAATAGARLGMAAEYGWRLCAAVYGSARWPIDEAACVEIAEEIGMPRADFVAALGDPETGHALAAAADEAHRRGAFGVPTFFLGERMFWGNDRLVLLRAALGA